jgi:hypothetical protein
MGAQIQGNTEIISRGGSVPSEEAWRQLYDDAKRTGLTPPATVPTSPRQALAVLEGLRKQAGQRVAKLPAPPEGKPVKGPVETGTKIAGGRTQPVTKAPGRVTGQGPAGQADVARNAEVTRLATNPRLKGVDKTWIARHLRPGLELLLGLEPGILARATVEELEAKLAALPNTDVDVRKLVMQRQQELVSFGLAEDAKGIDGIVGDRTRAANNNALRLFGPAVAEGERRQYVAQNLGDFSRVLQVAAHELNRKLPQAATAAAITALGQREGALGKLVADYQRLLVDRGVLKPAPTGEEIGVFGAATLAAHKAYQTGKAEGTRPETEAQDAETRIAQLSTQVDKYVEAGVMDGPSVANIMLGLKALKEAAQTQPKAKAGYEGKRQRVIREYLGQDVQRITRFAKLAADPQYDAVLDDILTKGIVSKMSLERQRVLADAIVDAKVNLAALPVDTLDILDSAAVGATRTQLMSATVQRKEIHKVLKEDLGFVLDNLMDPSLHQKPATLAMLDRIAGLPSNDPALMQFADGLAARYNDQYWWGWPWAARMSLVAQTLREVADRNGGVASTLIQRALPKIVWERRDDVAMELARPRSTSAGEEFDHVLLRKLTPAARKVMHDQVSSGWRTSAEKALTAHLETMGI